jgi:hypothetical protein
MHKARHTFITQGGKVVFLHLKNIHPHGFADFVLFAVFYGVGPFPGFNSEHIHFVEVEIFSNVDPNENTACAQLQTSEQWDWFLSVVFSTSPSYRLPSEKHTQRVVQESCFRSLLPEPRSRQESTKENDNKNKTCFNTRRFLRFLKY